MLAARTPEPAYAACRTVAVEGGSLPVWTAGAGPAVVCLHGWTLDHRMWGPQIAALAGRFRLVMPDRRGCGQASAPPDLAREAADVIAIADALGLESFALVGLSQGAAVALDVAVHFPERVIALVAAGAPLPALIPRGEALDLAGLRALVACGDLAGFRAAWGAHPLMRTHRPEAAALAARMLADYDGRDILAPGAPPEITAPALAMLPMPVLALAGEHDTPWRRACAAALAAAVPGARHGLIPRAGHLANADNPVAFNAALAAFLDPGAPA